MESSQCGQIWGVNRDVIIVQWLLHQIYEPGLIKASFKPTLSSISPLNRSLCWLTMGWKNQLLIFKKRRFKRLPQCLCHHDKAAFLSYLAPPVNFTSRSPTWASQLTLVTNGWPSTSLPSPTTTVTATSKIVMWKDPPSCLESTQKTKQQQKQTTWFKM